MRRYPVRSLTPRLLRIAGSLCVAVGLALLVTAYGASAPQTAMTPTVAASLHTGVIARMDSPALTYEGGWTTGPQGADPHEPADPWSQPAGVLTFRYTGRELALNLAPGDYWGYLYVTVDGAPANRMAVLRGNFDSRGERAGYRTLYAPERAAQGPATPNWVAVHHAAGAAQEHTVRVEVWRSWGQIPLRGVAVDALPAPGLPLWPGLLLALIGLASFLWVTPFQLPARSSRRLSEPMIRLTAPAADPRVRTWIALFGALLVAAAVLTRIWWLAPPGLAVLAYAALVSPSLWAMAWLFALPFYFSQTVPILPGRATNLVDLGAWGGLLVAVGHWLTVLPRRQERADTVSPLEPDPKASVRATVPWIAALAGWALVSAVAAAQREVALREWRTVFLAALSLGILLAACRTDPAPKVYRRLATAWLAGAVVLAVVGLVDYMGGVRLIEAEGVRRVRALYGSPNNLALYLERGLMVTLASALFGRDRRMRAAAFAASLIQGAALVLTFSKGALVLGLPAGLATLWLGGIALARRRRAAGAAWSRPLWGIVAVAGISLLALTPFLGAERFRNLLDFSQGTGLLRLYLWRSSLQMALDHPWLGVGPDNFLYAFRSIYLLPPAWQEPNLNHPHNWLLDGWTRLGLPGLALMVAWFSAGLTGIWRRLWNAGDRALWLGLLAAAVAALVHGWIDLSYAVPDLMLVWVLMLALPGLVDDNGPTSRRGRAA